MEGIKDVIKNSKEMLENLYNENENQKVGRDNSENGLRSSVIDFYQTQLESIQHIDSLRNVVMSELLGKLALHELDTSELQSLFTTLSREKTANTDSLLSMFRPVNGVGSSIVSPATKTDNQNEIVELSPNQRQAIEKLTRVMEVMDKKKMMKAEEDE